jgi:TRAP-type transport system periplasmic protein
MFNLRRTSMKKLLGITVLSLGLGILTGPAMADTINLKVMGQPLSTGLIQKNKEQPFFETLAAKSGLPIKVDYKPVDVTGIKDYEQLRILKSGLFDVISLRMSQVSKDEPMILGLDLVGLNPDYKTARKVVRAYSATLDKQLQKKFNAKLLGVWPFGPQVLFCKSKITKLADVKGKKVRVYDQNLAKFIESIGGVPVPIGFSEVHQSLARGVVDCAITGPSSANSAGWPEETKYFLPIGFQIALNGYAMNLTTWNKFSAEQKATLTIMFDSQVEEVWDYSKHLFDDAVRCNVGKEPCTTVKKFNLVDVPVTDGDIAIVQNAVREISYPVWAKLCDAQTPGCSAGWKNTVGLIVGLK